jgi:hypothetical protein
MIDTQSSLRAALSYMKPPKEQTHITEHYVSSPPALVIVDERGDVFTLGLERFQGPRGEYAFMILRNGAPTGELGSRIERRNQKIRIFTPEGCYKVWNGKSFL